MLDNEMDRAGERETSRERTNRPADVTGAVGDREVPLASHTTSDVINRWLDGETSEPIGLRGDAAKTVEFWRRIGEETDRRRRWQRELDRQDHARTTHLEEPKACGGGARVKKQMSPGGLGRGGRSIAVRRARREFPVMRKTEPPNPVPPGRRRKVPASASISGLDRSATMGAGGRASIREVLLRPGRGSSAGP